MNIPRILITGGSGFIGSHVVDYLSESQYILLNIDVRSPQRDGHIMFWHDCDIKHIDRTLELFNQFKPTHVLHLAAKANLSGTIVEDFPDNIIGTKNIVRCVNETSSVCRFIHTSTQYVVTPGVWPESDEYMVPYTAYGESKAEGERIVRDKCTKNWVIIRPTNIWGPFHPFFPKELWRYLRCRYYIHPGFKPIKKYYGFIDNAVHQIKSIMFCEESDQVCNKVFYITDPPINNLDWMNEFSIALSGKAVRRVPLSVLRFLAIIGDMLIKLGWKFPFSSPRLFRLTVDESVPYENIIKLAGNPLVSLKSGVRLCVDWYEQQYRNMEESNVDRNKGRKRT